MLLKKNKAKKKTLLSVVTRLDCYHLLTNNKKDNQVSQLLPAMPQGVVDYNTTACVKHVTDSKCKTLILMRRTE